MEIGDWKWRFCQFTDTQAELKKRLFHSFKKLNNGNHLTKIKTIVQCDSVFTVQVNLLASQVFGELFENRSHLNLAKSCCSC